MSLIFSVLTAAYGKGSHHRLALDGVRRLEGPQAEAWQRLFYKHAETLVTGSKAPDDQFKDFKNHVLHPRDNFWGGAPDKARSWYVDLVETLGKGDWPAAVWCAGVLSHYVTDPINPFHTAQSEAEGAIHRAFEWSISTSYAELKKIANADERREINIGDGGDWLEQLICQAASEANQHYEKLIAHYDIHRGVVDPPSGLDSIAQRIIGDLIGQASAVFAAVLQRAIEESKATPPEVSLTLDMIVATLKIPIAKVLKKLANAEERRLVERMYDELIATGKVEVNLPEDDRVVRDLHAKEVLGAQAKPNLANRFPEKGRRKTEESEGEQKERLKRIGGGIAAPGARAVPQVTARSDQEMPVNEPARPAPRAMDQAKPAGPVGRFRGEARPEAVRDDPLPVAVVLERAVEPSVVPQIAKEVASTTFVNATSVPQVRLRPSLAASLEAVALPVTNQVDHAQSQRVDRVERSAVSAVQPLRAVTASPKVAALAVDNAPRFYLMPGQPIVDAPSIGPKMAERLIPLGITTVAELLAAHAGNLAAKIAMSMVDADMISDWQDQARLVCTVAGLRGTHAQLLVGAGFRSAEGIAAADAADLSARVLTFATGKEGQRILRNGEPPDLERIKSWVDSARAVRAA